MPIQVTDNTIHERVGKVYFDDASLRGMLISAAAKELKINETRPNVKCKVRLEYHPSHPGDAHSRFTATVEIVEDLAPQAFAK